MPPKVYKHSGTWTRTVTRSWQCVNVNFPLSSILAIFSIYDFLRAVIDTISIVSIVVFLLDTSVDDVHFTPLSPSRRASDYEKYELFYFLRNRNVTIGIFIACIATAFLEAPLAVLLNKATKSEHENVNLLDDSISANSHHQLDPLHRSARLRPQGRTD
ncbi:unnamed protein product [Orchesella dallaii]|uniref:Uncharacterized protein n=1 Tax=Orchesella dallaii TaxID=48710 RepID=A0ABP1RWT4_9HEXA